VYSVCGKGLGLTCLRILKKCCKYVGKFRKHEIYLSQGSTHVHGQPAVVRGRREGKRWRTGRLAQVRRYFASSVHTAESLVTGLSCIETEIVPEKLELCKYPYIIFYQSYVI
jgi:hypothetical protein